MVRTLQYPKSSLLLSRIYPSRIYHMIGLFQLVLSMFQVSFVLSSVQHSTSLMPCVTFLPPLTAPHTALDMLYLLSRSKAAMEDPPCPSCLLQGTALYQT